MRRHKPLTVGREQPQHPSYHLVKMKTRVILIELTVLKHTKAVASQDSLLTDPRNWGWGYGRGAMS